VTVDTSTGLGSGRRDSPVRWGHRPEGVGAPGWCLAAYTFLLPVQFAIGPTLRLAPSDLFIVAYLVLRLPRLRLGRPAWSGWHLALCSVLLAGLLVAALSADVLTAYAVVQKGAGMIVLLGTFACLVDFCLGKPSRLAWLCRTFLLGVLVNVVFSVAALYLEQADLLTIEWINVQRVRLSGLLIDPNAFGAVLVVAICLHHLTRAVRAPLVTGAAGALLTGLLPLALALTYSRSAWIGMLAAALVAVWLHGRQLLVALGKLVAMFSVVAITAVGVLLPNAGELVRRPRQVGARLTIIDDALADFTSSPVLGVGLDVSAERHGQIIHNTTVWFLAELGPLGLLTLVGFLLAYWCKGVAAFRRSDGSTAALAAAMLAAHVGMYGVSMGIEALYQRQWWLVLAGLGVLYAQVRAERDQTPRPARPGAGMKELLA
jgi:putative inorganic carbon (hco3(-)) transporter